MNRRRAAAQAGERAHEVRDALYPEDPGDGRALFVPTEDMHLVRQAARPSAVGQRAGLNRQAYSAWEREYGASQPWLFEWLYNWRERIPEDAQGLPTQAMHSFRAQNTVKALAAAAVRSGEQIKTARIKKRYGPHVSHLLIHHWLEKWERPPWFKPWLLRCQRPPDHITVATADQVARARVAWDWAGHCHRTLAGSQRNEEPHPLDTRVYASWIGGPIPDVGWLKWLFGWTEPDGAFIVTLGLQRLREESSREGIAKAAGIAPSLPRFWEKERPLFWEALKEAIRTRANPPALTWSAQYPKIPADTKERLLRYAQASTLKARCERAGPTETEFYRLRSEAEKKGLGAHFEWFMNFEGEYGWAHSQRSGLLAPNFFVPSPAMLAFRKVAAEAMKGNWDLFNLPFADWWLRDWATPDCGRGNALPFASQAPDLTPAKKTETSSAATKGQDPGVRADNGADTKKKKRFHSPENAEILQLAAKIKRERGSGNSKNQIALDFTDGDHKKAASLLRELRRYPHLLN
jgi:hypothetical protein